MDLVLFLALIAATIPKRAATALAALALAGLCTTLVITLAMVPTAEAGPGILSSFLANGDLAGTATHQTVTGLQGNAVKTGVPSNGNVFATSAGTMPSNNAGSSNCAPVGPLFQ